MTGRVEGKAVIVTGAGSGMGRAFALGLAREGAVVGVLDVRRAAADAVAQAIRGESLQAFALVADVSKREQVAAAFDLFVEHAGRLDVLFNNAGFNEPMHLLDVTEANWHADHGRERPGNAARNPRGCPPNDFHGRRQDRQYILDCRRQGYPSFAPYCASKFAVNALTQAAARGLAEYHITCNAFAPGVVDTPLWTKLDRDLMSIGDSQQPGQAMTDFAAGIILGRAAAPEEIVGTALYLASSDSDYLTGQVIMIDGGMVLV